MGIEVAGGSGFPASDVIQQILLNEAGDKTYDAIVDGSKPFTDQAMADAWEKYGKLALTRATRHRAVLPASTPRISRTQLTRRSRTRRAPAWCCSAALAPASSRPSSPTSRPEKTTTSCPGPAAP